MTRTWPVPPAERTLHLVGDTHIGNMKQSRKDKVLTDISHRLLPQGVPRLQLGDFTANGWVEQDAEATSWMNALGGDWYAVVGNHDIDGAVRSPDQVAQAWGLPGKNYTVDLGYAVLIVVGPEPLGADGLTMVLSPSTLAWLDTQLATHAPRPCLTACHAPLYETVGRGDSTASNYISTTAGFYVVGGTYANRDTTRDTDVRAVLAAHANAKAWLSGHTHSPLGATDLGSGITLGGKTVAQVNALALWYVGKSNGLGYGDPLVTAYMTVLEDRIEVRYRDHGAGVWVARPGVGRVTTIPL